MLIGIKAEGEEGLIGMTADRYLRDHYMGIMADRLDSDRLKGFCDRQTNGWTVICDSRVAFATEKIGGYFQKTPFFSLYKDF